MIHFSYGSYKRLKVKIGKKGIEYKGVFGVIRRGRKHRERRRRKGRNPRRGRRGISRKASRSQQTTR